MKRILLVVLFFITAHTLFLYQPVVFVWAAEVVEVGNAFCPVSGDKISGKHFAEHQGKRYGFCCNQCMKKFNKNPEKYIAALEENPSLEAGDEHGDHSHV